MKKIAVILILLVAVSALGYSYRAYKIKTEADLAARRASLEERQKETQQRNEATVEAQRLAALQAEQAAAEEERKLAAMREEELAATQQRAAAEAEVARLNRQLEDLRRLKDAAIAMAEKTAEQREAELAAIAATQTEALAKLRSVESEKIQLASREAAHAAALQHQIELEKKAQERAARFRAAQPR